MATLAIVTSVWIGSGLAVVAVLSRAARRLKHRAVPPVPAEDTRTSRAFVALQRTHNDV